MTAPQLPPRPPPPPDTPRLSDALIRVTDPVLRKKLREPNAPLITHTIPHDFSAPLITHIPPQKFSLKGVRPRTIVLSVAGAIAAYSAISGALDGYSGRTSAGVSALIPLIQQVATQSCERRAFIRQQTTFQYKILAGWQSRPLTLTIRDIRKE